MQLLRHLPPFASHVLCVVFGACVSNYALETTPDPKPLYSRRKIIIALDSDWFEDVALRNLRVGGELTLTRTDREAGMCIIGESPVKLIQAKPFPVLSLRTSQIKLVELILKRGAKTKLGAVSEPSGLPLCRFSPKLNFGAAR